MDFTQTKWRILFVVFLVVVIFLVGNYFLNTSGQSGPSLVVDPTPVEKTKSILIDDQEIFVEVADTPELMAKGLSGRNTIAKDYGMLFVLRPNTYTSFWMKGMLMPIDIIWINDGEIVQIDRNIAPPAAGTPDESLELIRPKVPVDHVLEVGANVSTELGFEVGDFVDLSQVNLD